jgi:hypothetical protein
LRSIVQRVTSEAVGRSSAIVLSLLAACSSATTGKPAQSDRVIATTDVGTLRSHEVGSSGTTVIGAPRDAVLSALKAVYTDLGIEVKVWDPPRGQVGNRNFSKMYRLAGRPMSDYMGCGLTPLGPAANSYRITISLVSYVTQVVDSSRIETQLTASADDIASSKGQISCQTLGTLEAKVNDLVAQRLGG